VPRSSTTSVGELQAIVPSFHRHLRAANRSAAAMAAYVATEEAFAAFLAGRGMPTEGRIGPEGAHRGPHQDVLDTSKPTEASFHHRVPDIRSAAREDATPTSTTRSARGC
jgi:hypothetical protein